MSEVPAPFAPAFPKDKYTEALGVLDAAASDAPLPRRAHVRVQQAVADLAEFIEKRASDAGDVTKLPAPRDRK